MFKFLGVLVTIPVVTAVLLIETAKVIRDGVSEFTAPYVGPDL
jgi:hypothetical protein